MTPPIRMVSVPVEPTKVMLSVVRQAERKELASNYRAMIAEHMAVAPVREEGGAVQWVFDLTTCPRSEPFLIAYADGDVRMGHYLDNSKASVPWEGIRPLFGAERWDAKIVAWAKRPALATREEAPAEVGGLAEAMNRLDADAENEAGLGVGMLGGARIAADIRTVLSALRAQPQARAWGWDYEICTGCSASLSIEDIKASGKVSCCPDRRMVTVRDLVDAYDARMKPPAREDAQPVKFEASYHGPDATPEDLRASSVAHGFSVRLDQFTTPPAPEAEKLRVAVEAFETIERIRSEMVMVPIDSEAANAWANALERAADMATQALAALQQEGR